MNNLTTTTELKLAKINKLQEEWDRIDNRLSNDKREKQWDEFSNIELRLIELQREVVRDSLNYPYEIMSNVVWDSTQDGAIAEKQICTITESYDEEEYDREEVLANAKLIAAAPELLELVKELYESIELSTADPDYNSKLELINRAKQVIKKATGE